MPPYCVVPYRFPSRPWTRFSSAGSMPLAPLKFAKTVSLTVGGRELGVLVCAERVETEKIESVTRAKRLAAKYRKVFIVAELLKPESPFWFKNDTKPTPIPLFADSVKQFSNGPPPNAPRSEPAPPKLPDIPPLLQNLSLL